MNLPKDYQSKMQEMLGEEYLQYLDSFNHSYGQTLRVNQLKMEPADFIRRFLLSGQVSWCNTGFYYEGEPSIFTTKFTCMANTNGRYLLLLMG